jgi:fatty acid desaturase
MNKSYDRTVNPEIQRRLREFLTREDILALHRRSAWRHFALTLQQTVLLAGVGFLLYRATNPWIWIPLAVFQGFVILSFIILLHEQVHNLIFARRRPLAERLLGLYYALPSAISATQFRRWHLDHHSELGTLDDDPKRAYLSPRRVARWYKALYMTPALFVIYSIASARAARRYPASLRRIIHLEKWIFMGLHVVFAAWLWSQAGFEAWARVHGVPLFVAFPFAFTLNRLGQHYAIDPTDPAKWSTLVKSHPFWNWIFVYSNFHLEHHYLIGVPAYNLPALQKRLLPFYERIGLKPMGFGRILYYWFVKNRAPHTNWLEPAPGSAPAAGAAAGSAAGAVPPTAVRP